MTENRTTELLRKLLDKRGVKYKSHYLHTLWYVGAKLYMATPDMNGTLTVDNLMPEQAIAATLGSGTCRITASSTDGLTSDNPCIWFKLSCGHSFKLDGLEPPICCPRCGAKVVTE